MKLVIIIGNSAVGKMTVGQELAKCTPLKLFHNHMMIEPVIDIFGDYDSKVVAKLRKVIFEEFVESDQDGLIFTYMWAFDQQSDWTYLQSLVDIFENKGATCYFVELVSDQETRLARNETENRLKEKPSKRDIEFSRKLLLQDDKSYRLESFEGEIPYENYMKIDNTNMSPHDCAQLIVDHFKLDVI